MNYQWPLCNISIHHYAMTKKLIEVQLTKKVNQSNSNDLIHNVISFYPKQNTDFCSHVERNG